MAVRETLATNLKRLLLLSGKHQRDVADSIGVKTSTFSDWINGKSYPRAEALQLLSEYFNVNIEQLMREEGDVSSTNTKYIPVYARIVLDGDKYDMDLIIGYEEIPLRLAKTGEFFALKIKNDSMTPIINAGDIVIVREQRKLINGDIGILTIGQDEAVCKKVSVNEFGVTLSSMDYKTESMFFNHKEMESIPVIIIGKVIESRRKF